MPATLESLPDALLLRIALSLHSARAVLNFGECCKRLHLLMQSDEIWRALVYEQWTEHVYSLEPVHQETKWIEVYIRKKHANDKFSWRRKMLTKQYWDEFYRDDGNQFDWFIDPAILVQHLAEYISPSDRILITGCGVSTVALNLFQLGCKDIVNMDISNVAIDKMRKRYAEHYPSIQWIVGDVLDMKNFAEDGSFDVVLDKGVADTILFRSNANQSRVFLASMLREVYRILKPGTGRYILITTRKKVPLLASPNKMKNEKFRTRAEQRKLPVWSAISEYVQLPSSNNVIVGDREQIYYIVLRK